MERTVKLVKKFGSIQAGTDITANFLLYRHLLKNGYIKEVKPEPELKPKPKKKKA